MTPRTLRLRECARDGCTERYDDLLLPHLVAHRCYEEVAHALVHYRGDLVALLERLTGERWVPAGSLGTAA